MKKILLSILLLSPFSAQAQSLECEQLWYERNLVFAEGGLCYRSRLGASLFGDLPCTLQRSGDVFLNQEDRQIVSSIQAREQALGCRINTSQSPSQALLDIIRTPTNTPVEEQTFVQPETGWMTCNPDYAFTPVWETPEKRTLVGTAPNTTPLTEDPTDPTWVPLTLSQEGWQPVEGWIERSFVSQSCVNTQGDGDIHVYKPHILNETLQATSITPGIIPDTSDTSTGRANAAWTRFSWTHDACEPIPNTAFTLEGITQFRQELTAFKACLRSQESQDFIDITVVMTELGGQEKDIPGVGTQTVFPWDCTTCQSHYHSLMASQLQRQTWREDVREALDTFDESVRHWMLNRP